jgi:hypothetical protein
LFARLSSAFIVALALAAGAAPARGQSGDAAADLAAAKFLAEQKGLASAKLPKEQWHAAYAGPYWTSATVVSVTEKDDANGGLRRFDLEKMTTRDRESPAREYESWWVDASGAVVTGERRFYDEHSAEPKERTRYEVKAGKLKKTTTLREEGAAKTEDPEELDQPSSFVPDERLAILLVPDAKGTTYRFSTFVTADEFAPFTVSDLGLEKVRGRKGEVEARKLVLKERDGESTWWLDGDHRVVAVRWSVSGNLLAVGGDAEESRRDWMARPTDEADAAGDRLVQGAAALEKLVGEYTYGVYDKKGHARETVQATLKKEERDGKPCFHFVATIAEVGSGASATSDEWWLSPDGAPIGGSSSRNEEGEKGTTTVRVEGGNFILHKSDAEKDEKDATFPVAPRFCPDTLLLLRALAKEEKGVFRFSALDVSEEAPISVWFEVKGLETIRLRSGEVKAKRIYLLQNTADANAWLDDQGKVLLVRWNTDDAEQFVAGTLEESKKDLASPVGPPGSTKKAGEDE